MDTKQYFRENLISSPYCANYKNDCHREPRTFALANKLISPNNGRMIYWMLFDIDAEDSYFAHERADLPKPTITCVNRDNGHAHIAYGLSTPVGRSEKSRIKAYHYFKDIRYGYTKRLGADFGYSALLFKNPFNKQWDVEWTNYLYDLGELDDYLEKEDKQKQKVDEEYVAGLGRHSTIFELTRHFAYSNLFKFKKDGNWHEYYSLVENFAIYNNALFEIPLQDKEIDGIIRRICNWCWSRMNINSYSSLQSSFGKKAWSNTRTISKEKPWIELGISRRTFYNRNLHLNFERTKINGQVKVQDTELYSDKRVN